jgi:ABC-2 type transport system ATP-binding protein
MHALSVRQLIKIYANGVQALAGVDLDVPRFFALLGPNGAGKTTLIGIVTSLVNKTAGQVSVFGYDLDRDLDRAKSCIGIVPQEINFNMFEPRRPSWSTRRGSMACRGAWRASARKNT